MSKHFFVLLFTLTLSAGCNLMERHSPPTVAETPPYLQPRSELMQSQLAEMRAFHEEESAKMSEDLRSSHNREMASLEAVRREQEMDKRRQEEYAKTLERREQQWASSLKKTDNGNKKSPAPVMTSRLGSTHQTVR